MRSMDLVESVRASLRLGLTKLYSPEVKDLGEGLVFFGDGIDKSLLDARRAIVANDVPSSQWFLVTGRAHGMEWKDDMLDLCGLWVIEVFDDLERVRSELTEIARGR